MYPMAWKGGRLWGCVGFLNSPTFNGLSYQFPTDKTELEFDDPQVSAACPGVFTQVLGVSNLFPSLLVALSLSLC